MNPGGLQLSQSGEQKDIDATTDVFSRNQYEKDFPMFVSKTEGDGLPAGLLVVDLDNFKDINTAATHQGGDQALRMVAQSLKQNVGVKGAVYRYGGDEFVVLLPNSTIDEVAAVGRRLRSAVEQLRHPAGIALNVTIGASAYPESSSELAELFKNADQALLDGKSSGQKNAVHVHRSRGEVGLPSGAWRLSLTLTPTHETNIAKHNLVDVVCSCCYSLLQNDFGRTMRWPLFKDRSNLVREREPGWCGAEHSDGALRRFFEVSSKGEIRLVLVESLSGAVHLVRMELVLDSLQDFWPFLDRFVSARGGKYVAKISLVGIQGARLEVDGRLLSTRGMISASDKYETEIETVLPPKSEGDRDQLMLGWIHAICSAFSPPTGVARGDISEQYVRVVLRRYIEKVGDARDDDD